VSGFTELDIFLVRDDERLPEFHTRTALEPARTMNSNRVLKPPTLQIA